VYQNAEDDFLEFFKSNPGGTYDTNTSTAQVREGYGHAIMLVGYDNENESWLALNSWGPDWPANGAVGLFKIAYGAAGVGSPSETFGLICTPLPGSGFDPFGLQIWKRVLDVEPVKKGNTFGEDIGFTEDGFPWSPTSICYNYMASQADTLPELAQTLDINVVDILGNNSGMFPKVQITLPGGCDLGLGQLLPNCSVETNTTEIWNVTVSLQGTVLSFCGFSPDRVLSVAHVTGNDTLAYVMVLQNRCSLIKGAPWPYGIEISNPPLVRGNAVRMKLMQDGCGAMIILALEDLSAMYDFVIEEFPSDPQWYKGPWPTPFELSWFDGLVFATHGRLLSIQAYSQCFTGSLPTGLSSLVRLEDFSLSFAREGALNPACISELPGGLPRAWGQGMQSLRVLKLDMAGLMSFFLRGNMTQTTITAFGPTSSFWPSELAFPKLEKVSLRGMRLTGTLPVDLPERLPSLQCLDLGNNALIGTVPQSYSAIPWSETACPRSDEDIVFGQFGGFSDNIRLRGCASYLPEVFVKGTQISLNDSNCGVPEWLQNQNRAMLALRDMLMPLQPEPGSECDDMARTLRQLIPDGIDGVNASSRAWEAPYCLAGGPTACGLDPVDRLPRVFYFETLISVYDKDRQYKVLPGACMPSLKGGVNVSALVHDVFPHMPGIQNLIINNGNSAGAWPLVGQLPADIYSIFPEVGLVRYTAECPNCNYGINLPKALGKRFVRLDIHESSSSGTSGQAVVPASLPANWMDDLMTAADLNRLSDPGVIPYSMYVSVISDSVVGTIPRAWGKPGYNVLVWMSIYIESKYLSGCFPDRLHPAWKDPMGSVFFGFDPKYLPLKYCSEIDGQKLALSRMLATMSKAKLTSRGKARLNTWIPEQGGVANVNRDPPFCVSWAGVVCDDEGWVTGLDLSGVTTPSSVLLLSELVPHLLTFPNLKVVSLRGNGLRGTLPDSLVALTELESIDLSRNNLNGTLPSAWLAFNQLQVLRLSFNRLSGSIPASWGMMQSLRDLQLARNSFSGSLPAAFGLLQNLEVLDLSGNGVRLTGRLPVAWADASLVPDIVAGVQGEVQAGVAAAKDAAAEALAGLEEGAKETRKWLVPSIGPQAGIDAVELIAVQAANGPAHDVRVGAAAEQVLRRAAAGVGGLHAAGEEAVAVAGGPTLLSNLRTLYLGDNALTGGLIQQWSSITSLKVSVVC
jgi:hypothetical protein